MGTGEIGFEGHSRLGGPSVGVVVCGGRGREMLSCIGCRSADLPNNCSYSCLVPFLHANKCTYLCLNKAMFDVVGSFVECVCMRLCDGVTTLSFVYRYVHMSLLKFCDSVVRLAQVL